MTAAFDPPVPSPAPQPGAGLPQAMPSVLADLGVLAGADWAGQPSVTLAGALVDLERAESVLVAARSGVLAAFAARRGFEDLCPFHHLILIHRWGWTITLHPDGTTTATSPQGKQLHSHIPPPATAA